MTVIFTCVSVLLLWTLCASQPREVQQLQCFKTAKLGETVVIKCLTKSIWRNRVWYKQSNNKSLQLVAATNNLYQQDSPSEKYSAETLMNETTLTILHMTKEDVGTYYCGIINAQDVLFGSGTVLELEKESKSMQSVLQSPDSIRVQPGDSVTLSCSFNSSLCSEQTSVTWLKSDPTTEIIAQTSGNENIICDNTGETDCVYNLMLENVTSTEDGNYLCVVSAYGHSFTGTRIHVYGRDLSKLDPTFIVLTVLNVVFFVTVVVLGWLVHSYRKNQHTGTDHIHVTNT
ncbi:hypothetical protein NL108_016694 [Boleophthalmus pectinirostris]|nr:hypothetical protein NL108_016694 [Boleophthalmus pectinirostris]